MPGVFHIDDAEPDLPDLARTVRAATAVTPDLLKAIIAGACPRTRSLAQAGHTVRLDALAGVRAWMDAALELVALECPHWGLRRLACDDGLWFCGLSRQPHLPLELDQMAEACHEDPALAVIGALIEALRLRRIALEPLPMSGHGFSEGLGVRMYCDNFR